MIIRTFQEIGSSDVDKADQRSFLVELGWRRGQTWEELLKASRVMLISEAGAGKTYECQQQARRLYEAGEPAFFLELASLAELGPRSLLGPDEEKRLDAWLASQSDMATFFLDSVDELKLTHKSFAVALNRLKKVIHPNLSRARIVVTSRPVPFDRSILEHIFPVPDPELSISVPDAVRFAEAVTQRDQSQGERSTKIPPEGWQTVALMPLSEEQIRDFAQLRGVQDPGAFFADLTKRDALDFARRPQDLIELCADWQQGGIRAHADQVDTDIRIKLLPREDRQERAHLSHQRAREGACRLALAALLTRRLTIRHNAAADEVHDTAALEPSIILSDWDRDERLALLERPLFGFASYGRVRFHHRSVIEYLAAEQLHTLREQGMPFPALKRLLFAESKRKVIARPSVRPVAGWMAGRERQVYELLRDHDPIALIDAGDPQSLSTQQRCEILGKVVETYGEGGWRGLSLDHRQVLRFASPDLCTEIQQRWQAGIGNAEVRELLLNVIEAGQITACADIAYGVAQDPGALHTERITALSALVALKDNRLYAMAHELVAGGKSRPEGLARRALTYLFPDYLSVTQLCALLSALPVEPRTVCGLDWQLSRLIQCLDIDRGRLEALRDGLVNVVSQGLRWNRSSPHVTSDYAYLSEALAATCLKGLVTSPDDAWLQACILALRLCQPDHTDDKIVTALEEALDELRTEKAAQLFWAEDALLQSLHKVEDPWKRLAEILFYRHHASTLDARRDLPWIRDQLADPHRPLPERALLLEAAMVLLNGQDDWRTTIPELSSLVADQEALQGRIKERLTAAQSNEQDQQRWQREEAERRAEREQRDEAAMASWQAFWTEVAEHPDQAFSSEQGANTAWNLWRAMSEEGQRSQASGWNRRFIEQYFGKATADRLRQTLMRVWREEKPSLPGERPAEERHTTLTRWRLGLAALYAEAEDPSWARQLSESEAKLAARYALLELNGLPGWIEPLLDHHPNAVDAVLGQSLSWELEQAPSHNGHSIQLQSVNGAMETVAQHFLPRLVAWLEGGGDMAHESSEMPGRVLRLTMAIDTLVSHGDKAFHQALGQITRDRLALNLPTELQYVWLPTLMRLSPSEGVEALEHKLHTIHPAARSEAVTWLSTLFNDHRGSVNLHSEDFTPQLLLRLVRLAYTHVRIEDDAVHEDSYTPDTRDHAERARNTIVAALLNAPGEAGWEAKLTLANDPLCAHFRDRILAVADERWAEEIDSAVYREADVVALLNRLELPLTSSEAMLGVLTDRLGELDSLLVSDASPWENWACIDSERLMRREIARELTYRANGLYQVQQESVTAEEKETDIRLQATASDQVAVIELKLADERTARDLRDTLEQQLVRKYLAPEQRRAGCLLVTLARDRYWRHPETRKRLDLAGLLGMLREEARRIEASMEGSIHLAVHALDLRPRLPKEKDAH